MHPIGTVPTAPRTNPPHQTPPLKRLQTRRALQASLPGTPRSLLIPNFKYPPPERYGPVEAKPADSRRRRLPRRGAVVIRAGVGH